MLTGPLPTLPGSKMPQPDIFTETEVSLSNQLIALAGPNCNGCELVTKSVGLLVDQLYDAGYTDADSALVALSELSKSDLETRRLGGNLLASNEKCRGQFYGKCALGMSE